FVTWFTTTSICLAEGIFVRSGPPFPPCPVAPWQLEQLSAKIDLPAAAEPAPVLGVVSVGFGSFSPACSTPLPEPGACGGPIVPSRLKIQRLSPCGDAASALPPA